MSIELQSPQSLALNQAMREAQIQIADLTPAQLREQLQQRGRELYNKLNSWFEGGKCANRSVYTRGEYYSTLTANAVVSGVLVPTRDQVESLRSSVMRRLVGNYTRRAGIEVRKKLNLPTDGDLSPQGTLGIRIGPVPQEYNEKRLVDPFDSVCTFLEPSGNFGIGIEPDNDSPLLQQLDAFNANAALVEVAFTSLDDAWIFRLEDIPNQRF